MYVRHNYYAEICYYVCLCVLPFDNTKYALRQIEEEQLNETQMPQQMNFHV